MSQKTEKQAAVRYRQQLDYTLTFAAVGSRWIYAQSRSGRGEASMSRGSYGLVIMLFMNVSQLYKR